MGFEVLWGRAPFLNLAKKQARVFSNRIIWKHIEVWVWMKLHELV